MPDVVELRKAVEKLVAADPIDADLAKDLLAQLEQVQLTLETLQSTRIGAVVNQLRKKCEDMPELHGRAKALVKKWKKMVPSSTAAAAKAAAPVSGATALASSSASSSPAAVAVAAAATVSTAAAGAGAGASVSGTVKAKAPASAGAASAPQMSTEEREKIKRRASMGREAMRTGDKTRDACQDMLVKGLGEQQGPSDGDPLFLACYIEDCIYKEFKATNDKYKARIRSRYLNLKDAKNPELRKRVLAGEISPEAMAKMTSAEMASPELQNLREKYKKEAMDDAQVPASTEGSTDQFRCGKCGKRDCSFFQMQTRSADEPMTVFVTCKNCNNHWKFC